MKKNYFEGWYFKHQQGDHFLAFIPGKADSGAFVQMINNDGSREFKVENLRVENGIIYADDCVFSHRGCKINLPGVSGEVSYGSLTPLASDIMGPFRFFPMECRHGVISMGHSLKGGFIIDGQAYIFTDGKGYIEKDSGTSFPIFYQWLHCNDFEKDCSIMVSIANIPFAGFKFTGCICAVMYEGKEYRLATYKGVKILTANENHICLAQGNLLLEVVVKPAHSGHALSSPVGGNMSGKIRESANVKVHMRLWKNKNLIIDLTSDHGTYEYVPKP